MKFVYQTSINGTRQKEQAIVKQAAQKAGIDLELKSVTASVFFSSDVANPDTYGKFWADMQMYTTTMTRPTPSASWTSTCSAEVSQKANKWQGRNICRWRQRRVRQAGRGGRVRARPGQAGGDVHQDERHGRQRLHRHPADQPAARARRQPEAGDRRCRAGTSTSRRCRTGTAKAASPDGVARLRRAVGHYLLRRLLIALPSLLGISVVLFTVLALAPGDPFAEMALNPNVPPEVRRTLRAAVRPRRPGLAALLPLAGGDAPGRLGLLVHQPGRRRHADPGSACR